MAQVLLPDVFFKKDPHLNAVEMILKMPIIKETIILTMTSQQLLHFNDHRHVFKIYLIKVCYNLCFH